MFTVDVSIRGCGEGVDFFLIYPISIIFHLVGGD